MKIDLQKSVKKEYLNLFIEKYWFIPSDVLQRSIEANIWKNCKFKSPVLDIGIGNGDISKYIFDNKQIIDAGIDSNMDGLGRALKTNKYKKVFCMNAEKMTFKSSTFNSVVSNSTFEHIKNDLRAISEVSRVLKKGGLFYMTVPTNYLQAWIYEYEIKKINNELLAKQQVDNFNKRTQHLHYRSISEWKRIFKARNMEVICYKYFFKKTTALYWYKLFKIFTTVFYSRELWSIIGHTRFSEYLPKFLIKYTLEWLILKKAYNNGFFVDSEHGAQVFLVARKI